jgi:D-beta-D-heptose 7-phosphate kinase / D-beta-D-heptose 1-phosphate adenosyltransferase
MLVVVGDALLDRDLDGRAERLEPDAPVPVLDAVEERARPGGAGLAATLAAADGHDIALVCALGPDDAGRRLARLLEEVGVAVSDLGLRGTTPEKARVRAGGRVLVRLDRGAGLGCGPLSDAARRALRDASAVLVSDYGGGVPAEASVRAALSAAVAAGTPVVWDPHPRGAAPVPGVLLATPNEREAATIVGTRADERGLAAVEARARALALRWGAVYVCVTRGAAGALLVDGDGPPLAIPAPPVTGGDECGAGDRFAATAVSRLGGGALPSEAVHAAVGAASGFVAAGGAAGARAAPRAWGLDAPVALAERVRASGGTVVATGGCFDLLHAGHVAMLRSARALGDCLIVCLNSDDSVKRLKGPERPVVEEHDRAAILTGLECVDAVAVFDEDDPSELLRALRPHLWAKGGDYALADLPEARALEEWGGRAVLVPYVSGRSTTRLIREVMARAG